MKLTEARVEWWVTMLMAQGPATALANGCPTWFIRAWVRGVLGDQRPSDNAIVFLASVHVIRGPADRDLVAELLSAVVWTKKGKVGDGRPIYRDQRGRTLLQRPIDDGGWWTIRAPGMPEALDLGTPDFDEAKERADWTPEQWRAWRDERAKERADWTDEQWRAWRDGRGNIEPEAGARPTETS